jgi:hypothetical protein
MVRCNATYNVVNIADEVPTNRIIGTSRDMMGRVTFLD